MFGACHASVENVLGLLESHVASTVTRTVSLPWREYDLQYIKYADADLVDELGSRQVSSPR